MVPDAPAHGETTARVVLGTAGHIDHGKTSLIRALTGIDTDRLPEEKARGITIELGFAHLEAGGRQLGVVDVPGHERFVRAMVAGATGIDILLLVVAADEGVMPQTREHLDICNLLGIPRAVVALTKADLVDQELLALARDDVRTQLRGSALEKAAVIPCSAVTGMGLEELRSEIARLASEAAPRSGDGPARLPLDRVFTVKGFGTVATGTLSSGSLREGDEVVALPGGTRAKVRGLEVHGSARREALAGERTAANLTVERGALARGEVLVRDGELEACSVLDVELALLRVCPAPLGNRSRLLFHALTTQENATVVLLEGNELAPGGRSVAQVHLEHPIALLPGDRFILRGFQPLPGHGSTVGGGRVVRTHTRKQRRADAAAAALVRRAAAATGPARVLLEIEAAGREVLDRSQLRARLGLGTRELERALEPALATRKVLTVHRERGAVVDASVVQEIGRELLDQLDRQHRAAPLQPGVDREALRGTVRLLRGAEPRLFGLVLTELERAGKVVQEHDLVRLAGFTPRAAERGTEGELAKVHEIYRSAGLSPPWNNELPARLLMDAVACETALQVLLRRGELVKVKPDLLFERSALDALRESLRAYLVEHGQITPQEWKQLTGQTRKYAIPLAEFFDAEKLTLRIGDVRRLRR